jgi:hypothetical protein
MQASWNHQAPFHHETALVIQPGPVKKIALGLLTVLVLSDVPGQAVFVGALKKPLRPAGFEIAGDAPNFRIHQLKLYELQFVWRAP